MEIRRIEVDVRVAAALQRSVQEGLHLGIEALADAAVTGWRGQKPITAAVAMSAPLSCSLVAVSTKSCGGFCLDQGLQPLPHQFGDQLAGGVVRQPSHGRHPPQPLLPDPYHLDSCLRCRPQLLRGGCEQVEVRAGFRLLPASVALRLGLGQRAHQFQLAGMQPQTVPLFHRSARRHGGVLIEVEGAVDAAQQSGVVQVVLKPLEGGTRDNHGAGAAMASACRLGKRLRFVQAPPGQGSDQALSLAALRPADFTA